MEGCEITGGLSSDTLLAQRYQEAKKNGKVVDLTGGSTIDLTTKSMAVTYTGEDYTVSDAFLLRDCLREHGVAILPGVLTPGECEEMRNGLWAGLEHLSGDWPAPIRRADPGTWGGFYRHLYPKHHMLLQHFGLGQLQCVWDVRQKPRVVNAFSYLWRVPPEDMICSMDGVAVHLPPEVTGRGWHNERDNKLHCDQCFRDSSLVSYQGLVTANPFREGDATLTFQRGSHLCHEAVAAQFKEQLGTAAHWNQLTPAMIRAYVEEHDCTQECVKCPAGSLVLWDSRTIHSGRRPVRGRAEPNERYVVYVCMTPRSKASTASMRKRLKAFADKRTTGHNPHSPLLFPRLPRTFGAELPPMRPVPEPRLTDLGRRLVGYD